uniref:Nucleoside diphosphate kinase B n=1 Tax=Echeneis naucrates TaxID=173247 RepID=A0A665XFM1_ECHNA
MSLPVSVSVASSSSDMERTFIAVKPDGVQRGLCGEIIKRFEHRGFRLVLLRVCLQASEDLMKNTTWTEGHAFYAGLCKYMSAGPILAMVTHRHTQRHTGLARMMLGETNPADSKPGSIRGRPIDINKSTFEHHPGSDTLENAKREIDLWFKAEEFVAYTSCAQAWLTM